MRDDYPGSHSDPDAPVIEPTRHEREVIHFFQRLREATPTVYVTPAIVALNVLAFILMGIAGVDIFAPTVDQLIDVGANFGPQTLSGEWWRLFTSMFIHIGVMHIAFNMWVLWDVGQFVERLVGNFGFLVLYLVSGLAGSLASVWWNPFVVSAGASGAVFGVFGALLGYLVRQRRMIPVSLLRNLQYSGGTFLIFNLIFGLAVPGIDMAAHLGGLIAGFLGGVLVSHALEEKLTAGRWRRNLLLIAIAVPALWGSAAFMPRDVENVLQLLHDFDTMHEDVMDRYNELVKAHRTGMTDARFASALEEEILPPWKQFVEKFSNPKLDGQISNELRSYASLRYEALQALHAMLRNPDDKGSGTEYQKKWDEADAIAGRLQREAE